MQSKLAAIDRSQGVIEFDLSGKILSANENFLKAMGYTAAEVIGQHHRMFVSPDYAASAEYAGLWQRLNAGEVIAEKFMRLGKGGREVWIQAAYNPIMGKDGKPFMVIKYATDVTAAELQAADHAGQVAAIGRTQAVITFDLSGIILSANENFLRSMGYTEAEIVGRHHRMFVDPEEAAGIAYQTFWQRLSRGESFGGEFRRITKSGAEVWLQAAYNPILDPAGRPFKIVKYATDITEAKNRNADNAGQLEAINRSRAVIAFNLDGTIIEANANFLAVMGYTAEEVIGQHHRIFVDPAYAASPEYKTFWARLRDGAFHSGEFHRIARDGRDVWLQAAYNPIFDASGRLTKIVKYASDITTQVEQRQAFNLLSVVVNQTDNSVIITDPRQRIVFVNQGFERMTGYTMKEVLGRVPGHFLQGPGTDKATLARIKRNLLAGELVYEEILNYHRNNTPYWISMAINPVRGQDGAIERFVSIQADVTATKEAALEFNAKLRAIGASNAIAEWTADGQPLDGNDIMRDGESQFAMTLGALLDAASVAQVIREGSLRRELAVPRRNKPPMWIDALFSVLRDIEGRPQRILMVGADVTLRRAAVQASTASMTEMMQRIAGILEAVSGFARQTNLLSLNAAIEAARARESGIGFALVAQEIRKLAVGASDAIGEIDQLLVDGRAKAASLAVDQT